MWLITVRPKTTLRCYGMGIHGWCWKQCWPSSLWLYYSWGPRLIGSQKKCCHACRVPEMWLPSLSNDLSFMSCCVFFYLPGASCVPSNQWLILYSNFIVTLGENLYLASLVIKSWFFCFFAPLLLTSGLNVIDLKHMLTIKCVCPSIPF